MKSPQLCMFILNLFCFCFSLESFTLYGDLFIDNRQSESPLKQINNQNRASNGTKCCTLHRARNTLDFCKIKSYKVNRKQLSEEPVQVIMQKPYTKYLSIPSNRSSQVFVTESVTGGRKNHYRWNDNNENELQQNTFTIQVSSIIFKTVPGFNIIKSEHLFHKHHLSMC